MEPAAAARETTPKTIPRLPVTSQTTESSTDEEDDSSAAREAAPRQLLD
jgi:hypothetical protein